MWNDIPLDLLSHVFSFLSPDSLASSTSTCKHWHTCAKTSSSYPSISQQQQPPWFVAITHSRNRTSLCYAYNPSLNRWHHLPLDFFPDHPLRPLAPVGPLLLCRPSPSPSLSLLLCNPFTKQFRPLPNLNLARANPALGVVLVGPSSSSFQLYAAGGMSDAPCGGASFVPTLEMYDSRTDTWADLGPMPVEFAVRLTVWTPNESVCSGGVLYWMTSARAYSVMGFKLGLRTWREVKAPMADRLECAALVSRSGRLALFGGTCGGKAYVWELGVGDVWAVVAVVPLELGRRFLGGRMKWASTKCVGGDGAVYLYRDLGCGMLVWKEVSLGGVWEWFWVEGCSKVRDVGVPKVPIRGLLLYPSLDSSCMKCC
ncbi:hypothetical protein AAC387_Pa03g3511 [Persea americana]